LALLNANIPWSMKFRRTPIFFINGNPDAQSYREGAVNGKWRRPELDAAVRGY
jgi:hypothetical protein